MGVANLPYYTIPLYSMSMVTPLSVTNDRIFITILILLILARMHYYGLKWSPVNNACVFVCILGSGNFSVKRRGRRTPPGLSRATVLSVDSRPRPICRASRLRFQTHILRFSLIPPMQIHFYLGRPVWELVYPVV